MADKATAGSVSNTRGACEAVCIHTKKIFSSCRDKDCIEDIQFYPTVTAQAVLANAQSIRGGRVELIHVGVEVEPVSFNRGFYTVDMRFYYRVILQACTNGTRYTEVEGLATFDKRVILYGSVAGAKIYSSDTMGFGPECPVNFGANLPTAVVEAVDPLLLCAKFVDCSCGCCVDGGIGGVWPCIAAAFSEPLVFDNLGARRVCISIGQFSMVRLERDTQLLIPVYDYCIPSNACAVVSSTNCEDACEMFDSVEFPVDDFFPPDSIASNTDGTGNGCSC